MDLKLFELGDLGKAIHQSPTLYEARKIVSAAIQSSEPGSRCWIECDRSTAWFCYKPLKRFHEGASQTEIFDLEGLLQFVRLAAGEKWVPKTIRANPSLSASLSRTQNFRGAEVEKSTSYTAIAFPFHSIF